MPKATTEAAFESLVVEHLVEHGGYLHRESKDFDPDLAVIRSDLLGFVEDTQPKVWAKQQKIHGDALETNLLSAFDKVAQQEGVLKVLRQGFKFYGSVVRLASFRPAHGLNPDVEQLYGRNRVAVARQVHHDPKATRDSVDLVLFVNGVPVVTAELKNAMTHQKAGHAIHQYKTDRDPAAPLFRFNQRALVHFAVGSDEVWMTTRLAKGDTDFLPFNRGRDHGAGNPSVEGKHRTFYLWEEVWQRDSLLDLLARFLHLEIKEKEQPDGTIETKQTLIFPRYHQLDCVRKLEAAARENGAGTNYLVQHSAGSGKSNSIAWLAHRLASLHDAEDRKVYDGVVVITDRRVLDQQLQKTIHQIDHKTGVVRRIIEGKVKSAQLAKALEERAPIIVCTIHSFGELADKIDTLADRRYAIIVDEAHSSQSGDMATAMKEILGAASVAEKLAEEIDDIDTADEGVLRAALARGPQENLSYFAFTATPKFKTLELFGHRGEDGKPAPFHLYSMRQAIEEEFILDVLRGYTTYNHYFQLVKAIQDDPELDKKKASRALARFVSFHPVNLAQKTEVIVEHFRTSVMPKLGGQAKAMVVTGSRLHAVKYRQAFDRYLEEKGYRGIGVLVAFSGGVVDPDDPATQEKPYTEPEMNRDPTTGKPLPETALTKAFAGDRYNLLIVANKYQTGFDQPKLCAMYVDKRLAGVQAVQTLSRLNRKHPGKSETFVLDFVNERADILLSFQDYYEGTTVVESVDPQRLYELQNEIDAFQVLRDSEVEQFARVFFAAGERGSKKDNARLNAALDPAVDRFRALEDDPKDKFRNRLQSFVRLYAFLAQIVPFSDVDLERLYVYGQMLLRKLPDEGELRDDVVLGDDVALRYYRLEKEAEGDLELAPGQTAELEGPTDVGTRAAKDELAHLSTLIDRLNERFETDFDVQDLIDGVQDQLVADARMRQAAEANDKANFSHVFNPALDKALLDRHEGHREFINQLFERDDLMRVFRRMMLDEVYERLEGGGDVGR